MTSLECFRSQASTPWPKGHTKGLTEPPKQHIGCMFSAKHLPLDRFCEMRLGKVDNTRTPEVASASVPETELVRCLKASRRSFTVHSRGLPVTFERSSTVKDTLLDQTAYDGVQEILFSGWSRKKRIPFEEVKRRWRDQQTIKQRELQNFQSIMAPCALMSLYKKMLRRGSSWMQAT